MRTVQDGIARRNRTVLIGLVVVVAAMVGLSFAAVPLYNLFCRVTGYGGTTQIAEAPSTEVTDRRMKIRFDSMVNGLDWSFQPLQRQMEVRVGENAVAFFRAVNRSDRTLVGTATFNVTPQKAGPYFNKVDCFCFTRQSLEPGQSADMAVSFYVDPAIVDDVNLSEVKTITLSYTFFPAAGETEDRPATTRVSSAARALAAARR